MTSKKSEKANLEKHRSAFFQLGLVIALSVSLLAFEWVSPVLEKHEFKGKLAKEEVPYIISEIIPKKEEPKQQSQNQSQRKNNKPSDEVIIDSLDRIPEKKQINQNIDIPDGPIEEGNDVDEPSVEPPMTIPPFQSWELDNLPEFPGGEKAMRKFIEETSIYSQLADLGLEGKVWVSFVVDENGDIVNAKVVNEVPNLLGKEALRIISKMPQWKPGKVSGKEVPASFQVKIDFRLK